MTTMPVQKPGRSIQDVGTPREFIDAVSDRFGWLGIDLAANASNHVCKDWYGPGGIVLDSLATCWWPHNGIAWLNPPYANIGDWAKKCAGESRLGARILMLIPAAIGTNYFREWIYPFAKIYALSPRLTFVGHTHSYPKDLILCDYGTGIVSSLECWRWDGK